MTATTIRVQMAQRKDTAANWTAANPILLSGEIGYETDTKKFKIGDGTTNWNSLAYLPIPDGSGNLTITGNLEIGTTGSLTFEGSTANGFETTLAVTDPTADRTITLPNVSGTVVTTGDTGSVTSTMIADGTIVNADISGSAEIAVSKLANGTANQVIVTDGTNVSWSDNLTLAGDLTVNGTTTTINTENLLVEDKNIIIGNVATPSDVTADGGGITLKGATDKTINWVDATDAWTSSERFSYPLGSATAPALTFTGDPNTGIYSPGADQVSVATGGTERLRIDAAGQIEANGLGSAAAPAYSWIGDPNTGIYSPGADQVAISTNGTGRLFVDASGNVGVGTAAETGLLGGVRSFEITANTTARLILQATDSGGRKYGVFSSTDGQLSFYDYTAGSERARIDSSGRLGLGTSSVSEKLHVVDAGTSIGAGSAVARFMDATNLKGVFLGYDADEIGGSIYGANFLSFQTYNGTSWGERVRISPTGAVGIGTATPGYKLHCVGDARFESSNVFLDDDSKALVFGTGTTAYIIGSSANNNIRFVTNSSERGRWDSNGRFLVGTSSSPSSGNGQYAKLAVQGSTFSSTGAAIFNLQSGKAATSLVSSDDIGFIQFTDNAGNDFAWIRGIVDGTPGAGDFPGRIEFSTTADGASSPTERMRITNAGHILFGTTDADAGINGTPSGAAIGSFKVGSGEGFRVSSTGAHYWNFANDGSVHIFRRNGTNVGSITVSSGATAYNTSSDYRLKENVVPLTGAANRVNQLHVHRFNFIADPNKTVDGFIAHEAQAVVPECVTGTKDEVDADGNPVYQGIDQSKLVPLLTAALQEALAEIESLKARLDTAGI